jgi:hypothetical protein
MKVGICDAIRTSGCHAVKKKPHSGQIVRLTGDNLGVFDLGSMEIATWCAPLSSCKISAASSFTI